MRAFLYKLIHETIAVGRAARGQFPAGLLLASPAMAQSGTMHRYAEFFKYSDSAVKAMTENPQDRSAQAAKLFESFGGKMENAYWFPTGGEYDGMVIVQVPDAVTEEAIQPYSENDGQLY
jgi:uncharacterized protein with GYD domain